MPRITARITARERTFIRSNASHQFDYDALDGVYSRRTKLLAKAYFEQVFLEVPEAQNIFWHAYRIVKYSRLGFQNYRSFMHRRPVLACFCSDAIQDDRPEKERREIDLRRHIEGVHNLQYSRDHIRKLGTLYYYDDGSREIEYESGVLTGQRWVVHRRNARQATE